MGRAAFKGGVHPPERKEATNSSMTERAPIPERLVLPVSQHLGAPCEPLVRRGDRVGRGQVVATVDALVSAPVHSPVAGVVGAIGPQMTATGSRVTAIEVTPDPEQDLDSWIPVESEGDDVQSVVRAAGVVGLGGAAFPTSVKLTAPHGMPVHTVIVNGCECEPYLTCDHRLMLETPERVVEGARLIRDAVGAERIVVGIEDNKADAAEVLRGVAGDDVEVLVLPTAYPQGAEKQLIAAVLGREVPHGKLPAATGALVQNAATAAAVADAVLQRKPLMERIVTVAGHVVRPANYTTLLGTPFEVLVRQAGGWAGEVGRVIVGGPMTGMGLADLGVPVVKGTGGIVALAPDEVAPAVTGDQPCIRCGRCSDACPMFLQPFALGIYSNREEWNGCERFHALDCIECGCCSFACPTRRPLVQLIRRSKQALLSRGAPL